MLTRPQIIEVLREGGSVIWNGALITNASNVPSEAELALASNEKDSITEAKSNLELELARLQVELAKVKAAEKQSEKDEKKLPKTPKEAVEPKVEGSPADTK